MGRVIKKKNSADLSATKRDKEAQKKILKEQYKKLGENIKALRKMHGETQDQLAAAIGVTGATISYYERGEKFPSRDELYLISQKYHVSMNQLINGDFSDSFVQLDFYINDAENRRIILDNLLPVVCSEEASENQNFKEAYDLHLQIFEYICTDQRDSALFINDRCRRLYRKAFEEGIMEASANLIWWPMFESIVISWVNPKIRYSAKVLKKDTNVADLFKVNYESLQSDEEKSEYKAACEEVFNRNVPEIMENIEYLKNSSRYEFRDLAEYYTALVYMNGLISNRLSQDESWEMGQEMMRLCLDRQNIYAENYNDVIANPAIYDIEKTKRKSRM
jgi:transcriptional regulator with XRE-family HTH domain